MSIKLDLSHFFKDYRRQSIILINAAWERIKDVQDHIQSLFLLKDLSLLTNDGCFIPPRESVQVLKGIDGLKAFRLGDPVEDYFTGPEVPVTSNILNNDSTLKRAVSIIITVAEENLVDEEPEQKKRLLMQNPPENRDNTQLQSIFGQYSAEPRTTDLTAVVMDLDESRYPEQPRCHSFASNSLHGNFDLDSCVLEETLDCEITLVSGSDDDDV